MTVINSELQTSWQDANLVSNTGINKTNETIPDRNVSLAEWITVHRFRTGGSPLLVAKDSDSCISYINCLSYITSDARRTRICEQCGCSLQLNVTCLERQQNHKNLNQDIALPGQVSIRNLLKQSRTYNRLLATLDSGLAKCIFQRGTLRYVLITVLGKMN